ncbi:MAG: hypothetical protein Q9163_003539 [Psora crenata]
MVVIGNNNKGERGHGDLMFKASEHTVNQWHHGSDSHPPAAAPGSSVTSVENFTQNGSSSVEYIKGCVDKGIVKDLPIREGAKKAISTEAVAFISPLMFKGHDEFVVGKFQRAFSDSASQDAAGDVHVDAVVYHRDVDVPDEKGELKAHALVYYSGLVYQAKSA